jgi:DNA-binding transcriptional LysR family regulator
MVQDFAETLLTGLLAQFSELHPDAQIYVRVAGTAELQMLLERRQLDIVLGFAAGGDPAGIATAAMHWYGDATLADRSVIPLAVLETPCRFREAAIRALDEAGRAYRITVETPNLTTLRSAVSAGLGLTCRTHLFLDTAAPLEDARLPALPRVACIIQTAADLDVATQRLADLARATVLALQPAVLA